MDEVDFDNIIEEMEALAGRERRELKNHLRILICHLLKLQYQSHMKSRSWELTVREQRNQIKALFEDSPSLNSQKDKILDLAYTLAVSLAERETGLKEEIFPEECPYTFEEITNDAFFPEPK
jgi:hypothetical protein